MVPVFAASGDTAKILTKGQSLTINPNGYSLIISSEKTSKVVARCSLPKVKTSGKSSITLKNLSGKFIREMSFLSGKAASATVSTVGKVDYISWDRSKLNKLFFKSPSIHILSKRRLVIN